MIGSVEKGVLVGADGWLYLYGGTHRQFDFLTNKAAPSPESISNFVTNFHERSRFCEERGIRFAQFILPCKPAVMPEHIPSSRRVGLMSLLERHYLAEFGGRLPLHLRYARRALIEAKNVSSVFLKTDSHYSDHGNMVVARSILRHFGLDDEIDSLYNQRPGGVTGDLAIMIGRPVKEKTTKLDLKTGSLRIFDNLSSLPSNTSNIAVFHNPLSETGLRCMVVGDSFIKNCLKFLSSSFRDILYVRGPHFQPGIAERFKPDIIVSANCERYMATVEADEAGVDMLSKLNSLESYNPPETVSDAIAAQLSFATDPMAYTRWADQISGE